YADYEWVQVTQNLKTSSDFYENIICVPDGGAVSYLDPPPPGCGGGDLGGGYCPPQFCGGAQYGCYWDGSICDCECSPILIDTLGNGFDLTDISGGVSFDLKNIGVA